ncbi:uncharacterized protein L201_000117 [Kwoniella dendrophila CBS 6074]|uniref:F-box domain-containing protein n=1 Tax=Kwoniella dendrophila CBS 6074 TaxID=1295534 RepID=A0AAX4JIJ3_9TREE
MTVTHKANLDNLPDDVLGIIFRQLELNELVGLKQVGRGISERVNSYGIPLYLSDHKQSNLTISPSLKQWDPLHLVKYNHYINQSLAQHRFHALQIGSTWSKSVIPTLELTKDQLVVGCGNRILIHPLLDNDSNIIHDENDCKEEYGGKVIDKAKEYDLNFIQENHNGNGNNQQQKKHNQGGKSDIIGIVPIEGLYNDFIVAQFDGTIQKINIPKSSDQYEMEERSVNNNAPTIPKIKAKYNPSYNNQIPKESINTLIGTNDGKQFMTTSVSGKVSIYQTHSPWLDSMNFQLKAARAWSSLLTNSNSTTIGHSALLGIQGGIEIYPLSSISSSADMNSNAKRRRLIGPEEPLLSSPYDIQLPCPDTTSHNPNLLLSGWYDSYLRIHDLRSSSNLPVMEFSDSYAWADGSAFYSCGFIGEYNLVGGGSKHGTLSFFDIRKSKSNSKSNSNSNCLINDGWSVFSPGGKNSPVYKIKSDNGKIFGVTEKRLFTLSFDKSGLYQNGIISNSLQQQEQLIMKQKEKDKGKFKPNGWKGRGGKWSWTVKYDQDESEGATGYEHRDRGIELFDSLIAV